jgi:outer membrane protein assembly factor BamB
MLCPFQTLIIVASHRFCLPSIGFVMFTRLAVATFLVLSSFPACQHGSAAEQWPQFRGPQGDGHSSAVGLPTKWSATENVKWRTSIEGRAWSSPVVWDDQIWVTNAPPDGKQLFAICLDGQTGEVVHNIKVFDVPKPQPLGVDRNSYASPTPVIEEGRIYVHFGAHGTACLDTKTGETIWSRQDLQCNHHRGPASSPIVWEDLLILTFDGFDFQYVAALNKKTGKDVWRTDRKLNYGTDNGDAMKAYSTPQVVEVDGKPQLLSPAAGWTAAYEPRSGKEIWKIKTDGMNAACRPVVGDNQAFMCAPDGGVQLFAVKLGGAQGDVTGTHLEWSKSGLRYSSPILVDDLLYMASDDGVVTCLEAKTAKTIWRERLGKQFMSSPIYGDNKLYFCDEHEKTYVVQPGRKFTLLATNELPGGFMASPAVYGKSLILRTKDAVWRIEE